MAGNGSNAGRSFQLPPIRIDRDQQIGAPEQRDGVSVMYKKIMVPVDLAHVERLEKAIATATDLGKHYGIPICVAGVTAETPTEVAHSPKEFGQKLREFGAGLSAAHGLDIDTVVYASHDPAVDLDQTLIRAAQENGADLIVMASHMPGLREHIFASNAGAVASHAKVSVFVVR